MAIRWKLLYVLLIWFLSWEGNVYGTEYTDCYDEQSVYISCPSSGDANSIITINEIKSCKISSSSGAECSFCPWAADSTVFDALSNACNGNSECRFQLPTTGKRRMASQYVTISHSCVVVPKDSNPGSENDQDSTNVNNDPDTVDTNDSNNDIWDVSKNSNDPDITNINDGSEGGISFDTMSLNSIIATSVISILALFTLTAIVLFIQNCKKRRRLRRKQNTEERTAEPEGSVYDTNEESRVFPSTLPPPLTPTAPPAEPNIYVP